MDNLYLDEVIKLPERIDHVQMLTSIAKLHFKLVIVSSKNSDFSFSTRF